MCLKGYFLEDKTMLFYNAKSKSTGFEGRAGSGRKRVKR
jgi:cytochrome oxidase assembly protein ShyY1